MNFEALHPEGGRGAGLMQDLRAHKVEVIIGGTAILVTVLLYLRSRGTSGAPAPAAGATPGNLATGGSTSVSTDMLAAAMQQLSSQEQQDVQGIYSQLGSLVGTGAGAGSGSGSQTTPPPSGGSSGSSGGTGNTPSNPPVVQSNTGISPALAARNAIGDTNIISTFQQFGLPSWIGLQYVAQNFSLPSNPSQLATWLDAQGYRNPTTGAFTPVVSSGTVPATVQAELNAAYQGH